MGQFFAGRSGQREDAIDELKAHQPGNPLALFFECFFAFCWLRRRLFDEQWHDDLPGAAARNDLAAELVPAFE